MINPNLSTNLKSDLAQGHSVGDRDTDAAGVLYRWDGNSWSREPNHMQSQEHQIFTPDDFINKIKQQMDEEMAKFTGRLKEFDTNNPFSFDELQAKASAEERYNPYYQAELSDFIKGIDARRQNTEGERQLLMDMNKIQAGQEKRNLDEAIRASEEGYAGVGLYSSGMKERDTGLKTVQGNETTQQRELGYNRNIQSSDIQLGQIANEQATGQRKTEAARTTNVQSEIEKMRAEEQARWQNERLQYLGPEYTSKVGGLDSLLSYTFQP